MSYDRKESILETEYNEASALWHKANNALGENRIIDFYRNLLDFAKYVKEKNLDMEILRTKHMSIEIKNPGVIGASNEVLKEIGLKASDSQFSKEASMLGVALADFQNAKLPPNKRFDEAETQRMGFQQTILVYKNILSFAEEIKSNSIQENLSKKVSTQELPLVLDEIDLNKTKIDILENNPERYQSMDDLQHLMSITKEKDIPVFNKFMAIREERKEELKNTILPIKQVIDRLPEEVKKTYIVNGEIDIRKVIQSKEELVKLGIPADSIENLAKIYINAVDILEDTSKSMDERIKTHFISLDSLSEDQGDFSRRLLTAFIKQNEEKGLDKQMMFDQKDPHFVELDGQQYFLRLNKSIIVRDSKKGPMGRYEFYDSSNPKIYESPQSEVFRFQGLLKLDENQKLVVKHYGQNDEEKSRLIKILPNRDKETMFNMIEHWENVESHLSELKIKKPFFLPDAVDPNLGTAYIVMKEIHGMHLSNFIKNNPNLSDNDREKLMYNILDALEKEFHSKNLVHCDIKPENIIINQKKNGDFEVHFIDIDDTKQVDKKVKKGKGPAGTPGYLSPEIRGKTEGMSKKSDIFALGVVLAQLMTKDTTLRASDLEAHPEKLDIIKNPLVKKILQSMANNDPESRPELSEIISQTEIKAFKEPILKSNEKLKQAYLEKEFQSIEKYLLKNGNVEGAKKEIKKLHESYAKTYGVDSTTYKDVMVASLTQRYADKYPGLKEDIILDRQASAERISSASTSISRERLRNTITTIPQRLRDSLDRRRGRSVSVPENLGKKRASAPENLNERNSRTEERQTWDVHTGKEDKRLSREELKQKLIEIKKELTKDINRLINKIKP